MKKIINFLRKLERKGTDITRDVIQDAANKLIVKINGKDLEKIMVQFGLDPLSEKFVCEKCEGAVSLNDNYCSSCGSEFLGDKGKFKKEIDKLEKDLKKQRKMLIQIGRGKSKSEKSRKQNERVLKNIDILVTNIELLLEKSR